MSGNGTKHGLWIGPKSITQMDGRKTLVKCFKQVKRELVTALGGDISPQQQIIIERAVFKLYRCVVFEQLSLDNKVSGIDEIYLAWSNSLRRDLETLGLKRIPKDLNTLQDYVKQKYGDGDGKT